MSGLVVLDDVGFSYAPGRPAVLSGVHGTIERGATVAIVGPSGSGKSTLLHLIAGLERPTTGEVEWVDWGTPRVAPGLVGLMFQAASLVPDLDARENVALPLLLDGVDERAAADRADEALERLGIGALGGCLPHELSGGQGQRVNLARALVSRPRMLLTDEPTGQLDHSTADEVLDLLTSLVREEGIALVVSTHDERVMRRLDQRWVLAEGTTRIEETTA